MPLTSPPTTPTRTMAQADFDTAMAAYISWFSTHVNEVNQILPDINYIEPLLAPAISAVASAATLATSATSLAIPASVPSSKSFTLAQTGKSFSVGHSVVLVSQANPNNWMVGTVTAFTAGTGAMTVSVLYTYGTGTYADWAVALTSLPLTTTNNAVVTKSATYQMLKSDLGQVIAASGTWSLTYDSAATLGNGWYHWITTAAGSVITLDPNGAETISAPGGSAGSTLQLPAQCTAVVYTDGSNFVCSILSEFSAASASSTASVTLTAASNFIQTMAPTDCGQCFTLPDATTMAVKKASFLLENTSDFSVGVRDNSGTLKYVIPPRSSTQVACRDASTAAGKWVFSRDGAPGMATLARRVDGYVINASADAGHFSSAILSSTVAVSLINNASGHLYVVAGNPNDGSVGTPTLIEAVGTITYLTAIYAVSSTTALAIWNSGGTPKAAVISVSGNSCSVGAIASAVPTGTPLIGSQYPYRIARLSATSYLLVMANGSNEVRGHAISVSGTTVSIGASTVCVTGIGASGAINYVRAVAIDSARALIWATSGVNSNNYLAVASLSGTTITAGSTVSLSSAGTSTPAEIVVCSATQLAAMVRISGTAYSCYAIAVSGSTLTASSSANVTVSAAADVLDDRWRSGFALSGTEALFCIQNNTNDQRQVILTVSGSSTPTAPSLSIKYSDQTWYPAEPAVDYWPTRWQPATWSYSNSLAFGAMTRSGGTISEVGRVSAPSNALYESNVSCKLSGAYSWLYTTHWGQAAPRAFVIKKLGSTLQSAGEVFLPVGHSYMKSAMTQSGQKIYYLSSVGSASSGDPQTPVLNCIELVS